MAELTSQRAEMNGKIAKASLAEIEKTPELLAFARAQGGAAFAINCSPCHGAGGQGSRGYPNLNADRWLWGGSLDAISATITHGARWDADAATHSTMRPPFGRDAILKPKEISNVADYVRTLSGNAAPAGADMSEGAKVFADNCAAWQGPDGKGNKATRAAN